MSAPCDITFRSMGSDIRLIVEAPLLGRLPPPLEAARAQRLYVEDFAARLSRFRADSELCALNRDPREEVPASILLRTAVSAGLWAARRSGGLVDPTLVDEIESVGYEGSQEGRAPASLTQALEGSPALAPARPNTRALWRSVEVDDERGLVRRPQGVRIDTGGTGKGLAADAVAHRLRGYTRFVVDCGGDIAVGGVGCQTQPLDVEVEHPLTGEPIHTLRLTGGGVATSGLNVRIWRREDGDFAHHLLDPSSGQPVWSGLIGATALAPSALEAETLTKIALLSGPMGARVALAEHGGLMVHNDGEVELVGTPRRRRATFAHLSGHAA
ncbi:MAG TPA: FAD:protein FMN transferase [Solirubrobacteraceae bacterium]|jgi:thiamine biosynthesis lipoprotein